MTLSIVGSVAFDTLFTPEGTRERILGGSASYAAIAASLYTKTSIISVVGQDFRPEYLALLQGRGIDIQDIQRKSGMTFHWTGSYLENINSAKTVETQIGVLGEFVPELCKANAANRILFLANNDPDAQANAVRQSRAEWVALDTMNLWIDIKKASLAEVIQQSQILFINEGEIKQFTGEYNLIGAAEMMMQQYPNLQYLVLKKGEFGASLFGRQKDQYYTVSAYPLSLVKDPTGAGDSFAGSFLGYLAEQPFSWDQLKQALNIGSAVSSFTVQEFGPDRLLSATDEEVARRVNELKQFNAL